MHSSIPALFAAVLALGGDPPQKPVAPDPAPKSSAPVIPFKWRADNAIQARAGSITPRDDAPGPNDGVPRIERFLLEAPLADPAPPPASSRRSPGRETSAAEKNAAPVAYPSVPKIVGAVEWRRLRHADGFQIECQIVFARSSRDLPCQRVLHVEELCDTSTRLVWREMGAGSGRTLLAEWMPGGVALRTVEWDKKETLREEINAQNGAVMPLYMIEMLRQGRATTGRYPMFDPLARALAEVEVFTSYGDELVPSAAAAKWVKEPDPAPEHAIAARVRTVELLRDDGSLCGRFRFRGAELVAFQWQEGGPWARRANAHEYESALSDLESNGAKDP